MKKITTFKKAIIMMSLGMTGFMLNAQAPTDMVGYFNFDALTGGNVTCTGTAAGSVGALVGNGTTLTSSSKFGANALKIDPTNGDSYVEFDVANTAPFIYDGNTKTIALWVKPEQIDQANDQRVLSLNSTSGGETYYFEISTNNEFNGYVSLKKTDRTPAGGSNYKSAFARATNDKIEQADLGTWIHFAFTFDGTNAKIYVDGVLDKDQGGFDNTYDMVTWSNLLYLGAKRKNGTSVTEKQFKGSIDELYFYDRALSAVEIAAVMNGSVLGTDIEATEAVVSVYPNPAKETLHINVSDTVVSYKIISIAGVVLMEGVTTGTLNVASLDAGIYVLHVDSKKPVKFIKL